MRKAYPTCGQVLCDVSNREWKIIEPLLPPGKLRGRKRDTEQIEVVNAIFYLLEEGCQWRALPHDFPHWSTVRTYFDKWNKKKIWYQMNRLLREELRQQQRASPHVGREKQQACGFN